MKTTRRTTMWMAAAALALGSFGLAEVVSAQPAESRGWGRGMPGMRHGGPMMDGPGRDGGLLLRQLDLTDAQRDQIRAINEAHRDEARALGEKARAAREAMRHAMRAETVDESAIRAASAATAEVQAERALLGARIRAEINQVLTPEQREKAKQLAAEREQRMKQRLEQRQQRFEQRQQRPRGGQRGLWF